MTSFCTSASHQVFCPIKCSLESEVSHPSVRKITLKLMLLSERKHISKNRMDHKCVFDCLTMGILFSFPTKSWVRVNLLTLLLGSMVLTVKYGLARAGNCINTSNNATCFKALQGDLKGSSARSAAIQNLHQMLQR